jgi:hypothetical protein
MMQMCRLGRCADTGLIKAEFLKLEAVIPLSKEPGLYALSQRCLFVQASVESETRPLASANL